MSIIHLVNGLRFMIKSNHALILNRLHQMQQAPYYATAKEELALAEQTILDLELELTQSKELIDRGNDDESFHRKRIGELEESLILADTSYRTEIANQNILIDQLKIDKQRLMEDFLVQTRKVIDLAEALQQYSDRRQCPECNSGSRHCGWCSIGILINKGQ